MKKKLLDLWRDIVWNIENQIKSNPSLDVFTSYLALQCLIIGFNNILINRISVLHRLLIIRDQTIISCLKILLLSGVAWSIQGHHSKIFVSSKLTCSFTWPLRTKSHDRIFMARIDVLRIIRSSSLLVLLLLIFIMLRRNQFELRFVLLDLLHEKFLARLDLLKLILHVLHWALVLQWIVALVMTDESSRRLASLALLAWSKGRNQTSCHAFLVIQWPLSGRGWLTTIATLYGCELEPWLFLFEQI